MWSQSRSHWLIFCAVFLMMCLRDCCQAPTDSLWLTETRLYVCVYISVLFDQCCFSITTHSHWLLMRDSISVAGRRSSREREREVCYLVSGSSSFERSLSANVIELLLCCYQSIRRTKHVRPQQPVPLFRCHGAIKVLTQVTYTPPCHLYRHIPWSQKQAPTRLKDSCGLFFVF